jgi:hypothetical protein
MARRDATARHDRAAAKGIRKRSAVADALSPSLADEIAAGMELLRGTRKAEGAAADVGVSRTIYYELLARPLDLTIEQFLRLIVRVPDPRFNARVRGHLAALDAYQAVAEREAGDTYVRITTGQKRLPLGEGR